MADIIGRAVIQVVSEMRPGEFQKAGNQAGSFMTGALKTTAVAAGAGIGALVGGAIYKGFQRLNAIEQAEAKLKGLGNSTQTVAKIMDNALASVKGTAFGLDEAASIAASAVASGVKPGQELERTLRLVGDAATIGGTSLAEMGAIFNKVSATGKIQGEVLNQLGERGIPIIQLLAESLGVTNQEVIDLASQGQISFAEFQKAIEDGMGGAALKSGETFAGAMNNAEAALGRVGAALLGPGFASGPAVLGEITEALDEMLPYAERVGQYLAHVDDVLSPPEPAGTGTVLAPDAETPPFQTALDVTAEEAGYSWWDKFMIGLKRNQEGSLDKTGEEFRGIGKLWADALDGGIFDGVSNALENAETAIGDWFSGVAENWRRGWDNITNIWPEIQAAFKKDFEKLVEDIKAIPGRIKETAEDWASAGSKLIGSFISGLIDNVTSGNIGQKIKDAINKALPDTVTFFGGRGGVPAITVPVPQFAGGVRNFGGGLAVVGETGPELVGLPAGSNVYSTSESGRMATGDVTNVFNIATVGPVGPSLLQELNWWGKFAQPEAVTVNG